jgi:serine/threonine-protein kinase RsbW
MQKHWLLPAVPESIRALRIAVGEFAADGGVPEPPLADVKLAVTEAATNAVVHSYRNEPEPGPIDVYAQLHDSELRLVVADEGLGMAPRNDSPGSGLGLALIAAVTDRYEIRPRAPRGTEVHLLFRVARVLNGAGASARST